MRAPISALLGKRQQEDGYSMLEVKYSVCFEEHGAHLAGVFRLTRMSFRFQVVARAPQLQLQTGQRILMTLFEFMAVEIGNVRGVKLLNKASIIGKGLLSKYGARQCFIGNAVKRRVIDSIG